jgi:hypothetical protein
MSLNVIDAVIQLSHSITKPLGFIPTRRQVDYSGGYVNEFTTRQFVSHVRAKGGDDVVIIRDHGGPMQGAPDSDELKSFEEDSKCFQIIHVDPWLKYPDYESGMLSTVAYIKHLKSLSSSIFFEVGTEEAVRKFDLEESTALLEDLERFGCLDDVIYFVIQSGANIDILNKKNIGKFDFGRLENDIKLCRSYGVHAKEHNSDFFTREDIDVRFSSGLKCMNVGPEIIQEETLCYIEEMTDKDFKSFYNRVFESGVWKKWMKDDSFSPIERKLDLVTACGHYLYKDDVFKKIINKMDIRSKIIERIQDKIMFFIS